MHITAQNLPEHFPKMPKRDLEKIYKEYFLHYIIYKKQKDGSFDCYCTKCKTFFKKPAITAPEITNEQYYFAAGCKHNKIVECPHCHSALTAKSNGRTKGLHFYKTVMIPVRITKTTGWIVQTNIAVKHSSVDLHIGHGSTMSTSTYNVIRIEDNNVFRFYPRPYCNPRTDWGHSHYCTERNTVFEPQWNSFFEASRLTKNTKLKYLKDIIMPNGAIVYNPIYIISTYLKYPALEKLIKAGFKTIDLQIKSKLPYKRTLNLKATKINEILRLPPQIYSNLFKSIGVRSGVSLGELKIIQAETKNGNIKIDLQSVQRLHAAGISAEAIKMSKVSCADLEAYFKKQQALNEHLTKYDVCGIYNDYLNECRQLGYDLTDKLINRPKRLTEKHAETAQLVTLLKDKIKAEQIQKEMAKCQKKHKKRKAALEWEWRDLKVIVPDTAEEIIAEGRALSHCVGGYAERHIKNTTTICFVREKKDLKKPCWTMEVRKDGGRWNIVQLHGFKNQDKYRHEHFQAFRAAYERHLQQINKKERRVSA